MVLQMLGDRVMRPFLQDTIQFWPLSAAMTGTLFIAPLTIFRVLIQVSSLAVTCAFHCCSIMLIKLLYRGLHLCANELYVPFGHMACFVRTQ